MKKNRMKVRKAVLEIEDEATIKMQMLKDTMSDASSQSKKKMAKNLKTLAEQIETSA